MASMELRVRWLAIVAGCVAAIALSFAGGPFLCLPLILSAIIQPRAKKQRGDSGDVEVFFRCADDLVRRCPVTLRLARPVDPSHG